MRHGIIVGAILGIAIAGGLSALAQQLQTQPRGPWGGCCGVGRWPMGPGMMGGGYGSMPRHHYAMMSGVPAAYRSLSNPLARTRATVEHGAQVYQQNCASCHGPTGAGDGEAGRNLSPPPGNLAWLSQMPMVQWDPFMYWTVAEGGGQFGTAMPAFKDTVSKEDIWAVIAYIQARLPQAARK